MRAALLVVIVFEESEHVVRIENVIAHGGERHVLVVRERRGIFRFLLESDDAPVLVDLDDAELARFADRNRNCGDRCNGVVAAVEIDHLADVHLVDVVSAENGDEIGLEVFDQRHVLVNRVCGSAVPCAVLCLHLSGNRDDEASADLGGGNVPAVDDVFHQALGFELSQNEDAVNSAVDEVTEHEVDNSVFSAKGDGGFRALVGQRSKSGSFAACQDHAKYGRSHFNLLKRWCWFTLDTIQIIFKKTIPKHAENALFLFFFCLKRVFLRLILSATNAQSQSSPTGFRNSTTKFSTKFSSAPNAADGAQLLFLISTSNCSTTSFSTGQS